MSIHDDFHDVLPIRTQADWLAWLAYMQQRHGRSQAMLTSLTWTWYPHQHDALDCPGVRIEVRRVT